MLRGGGIGSAFARFGAALVLMFGVVVVADASAPAASGPRWPVVRTPSPSGPPNGELYGVSCASAGDCMAVGTNYSDGGVIIIDQQARFRRWSKAACSTPAACLAPRARQRAADPRETVIIGGPTALIEHWDGGGWKFAPAPSAVEGELNLVAVDCPATNLCFAVGDLATFTLNTFDVGPVVERWNGSTWTTLTVPEVPGSVSTALNSIDCTSATHCVAVGDSITGNFRKPATVHDDAVIAEWDGTAWTIANTPAPTDSTDEFLSDVSCVGGTCIAVGGYLVGDTVHPLTVRSTGSDWTAGSGAIPAGQTSTQLVSVACTGVSGCTAAGGAWAGSIESYELDFTPVAERWNGSSWSIQPVPLPAGADGAGFYAVACAGASDCSAVGFRQTSAGDPDELGEAPFHAHWNGSSWSVVTGPDPTPFFALFEVACPASNACFATGGRGVLEQWTGTTWFVSRFAGKASQSSLADVDCLSATSCVAVGSYRGDGDDQPLAERWNGSRWRKMTVPAPASGAGSLTVVSCLSVRDCTAVGSRSAGGRIATLVEHWNGTTWSIVPSPSPKGPFALLTGVDCPAAGRCVAVGVIFTNSFSERAFSAFSVGGRWTLARLPIPDFAELAEVTSVSCRDRDQLLRGRAVRARHRRPARDREGRAGVLERLALATERGRADRREHATSAAHERVVRERHPLLGVRAVPLR